MAISKYTLYKYVKVAGTWRYRKGPCRENGKIKPDIVFVNVKQALSEKHAEGRYYMNHNDLSQFSCAADLLRARHSTTAAAEDGPGKTAYCR